MNHPDAVVVGSGPNGLAAAILIAQAGRTVVVFEAEPSIGGGVRSEELTLPGFVHDVCSAVHPLAVSSPFFRTLPLATHGLEWIAPPAMLAHPLDDGSSGVICGSIEQPEAFALVLGAMAHVAGWPMPRGGAQRLTDALAAHLRSLGGEIVAGAASGILQTSSGTIRTLSAATSDPA